MRSKPESGSPIALVEDLRRDYLRRHGDGPPISGLWGRRRQWITSTYREFTQSMIDGRAIGISGTDLVDQDDSIN